MRILKYILLTLLLAAVSLPIYAQAATLSLSPQFASYTVGSLIPVNVYVSSLDQAMNAVSAAVSFPKDKLDVVTLSKDGSIINLWVRDPSISATLGRVSFSGIVLNPGFTGSGGKLMTIVFRAKAPGAALINFDSGSVLANDGLGTEILTTLGKASLSLTLGSTVVSTSTPGSPLAGEDYTSVEPATTSTVIMQQAGSVRVILSMIDILALLIAVSALVIGFILLWLYAIQRIWKLRRSLKTETHAAEPMSYETLRGAIQEHLNLFTKKENKTKHDLEMASSLQHLEERLDTVEGSIQEELQKIEAGEETG